MTHADTEQPFSAERHYFSQLEKGQFTIPRCRDCDRLHFFPRMVCPHCGSDTLEWVTPSGQGEVYATTIVRHKVADYTVCLIDLDEGPRLMSRVVDVQPEQVRIGMRVQARVDVVDEKPLLVFMPAEKEQA